MSSRADSASRGAVVLHGDGVSGGQAAGPVFVGREEVPQRSADGDLGAATRAVTARLRDLAQVVSGRGDPGAEILEAQAMMAEDPTLLAAIDEERTPGKPLTDAVAAGADRVATQLDELEDEYLRARAEDVREVGRLLALQLSGASGLTVRRASAVTAARAAIAAAPEDLRACVEREHVMLGVW